MHVGYCTAYNIRLLQKRLETLINEVKCVFHVMALALSNCHFRVQKLFTEVIKQFNKLMKKHA
jgi:hypothetical protein